MPTAHQPEGLGRSKGDSPDAGGSALGVVCRRMHISIAGNWASNSLVFAISHGSCAAAPSTPSQRSTLSHHAVVPSRFRVQVRRVTQRLPPSEPLLSARVIQRRVRRRNFAMCGFPSARTTTAPPPHPGPVGDGGPTRSGLAARPGERAGMVPTFTDLVAGRCPAISRRPRHGYAAGLHRGLLPGRRNRPRSCPPQSEVGARRPQPISTRFELVGHLRRLHHRFLAYTFSSCSPGPPPSGSAGHVPALSGLLPPSPASPGSGCPQLQPAAATASGGGPFTSTRSR